LSYIKGSLEINPKVKSLFPVTRKTKLDLAGSLFPKKEFNLPASAGLLKKNVQTVIVFSQHRYYSHLNLFLYEGQASRDGKIKNPLKNIDPANLLWTTENISELKFLNGILKFQHNYNAEASESDLEGLKALARNPLG